MNLDAWRGELSQEHVALGEVADQPKARISTPPVRQ